MISDDLVFALTLFAALGSGLMAGLFFVFSNSVMKALAALPPGQGIAAMQSINRTIINPWFMAVFFGTGGACLLLLIIGLVQWHAWLLAGSVLCLAGCIVVTIVCNVPRNNALAALDPAAPDSVGMWRDYLAVWTAWNDVRTISTLAAAAALTVALCRL